MGNQKLSLRGSDGKIYYGWKIVALGIILMTFAYSCVVSIVGCFVLPVTTSLDITIGAFTLFVTIMSAVSIIFLAIFSKIYSKNTTKKIMVTACVCGIIAFIGFGTSNSTMQFYIFSIPLGICFAGLTTTPSTLLASNWFGPAIRGRALGIIFGGNSFVVMILIPIINAIIQSAGWRIMYFILAACLLCCIPLILTIVSWSPEEKGIKRMGDFSAEEAANAEATASLNDGISFKDGLKRPSAWILFISGTLLVIASASVLSHGQPYMEMNGLSSTIASGCTSIMIGIALITCILIGKIADKFGVGVSNIITGLTFAACYLSLIFVPHGMIFVILYVVFYGLGCPAVNIVSPLIANHMFGDKEVGSFIGYINMFISVGGAISGIVVGQLFDKTGGYFVPFVVCIALLLTMMLIRMVLCSKKYYYKNNM